MSTFTFAVNLFFFFKNENISDLITIFLFLSTAKIFPSALMIS